MRKCSTIPQFAKLSPVVCTIQLISKHQHSIIRSERTPSFQLLVVTVKSTGGKTRFVIKKKSSLLRTPSV